MLDSRTMCTKHQRTILQLFILIDLVGLGGAVDGYTVEHTASCNSNSFTYKIKTPLTIKETGLGELYISTFKPNGILKVWAR